MRLADTRRLNRAKPLPHQRPGPGARKKVTEVTREAAFAIKARVKNMTASTFGPWRWHAWGSGFTDHWFQRGLFPRAKADSLKAEIENFGGQQVKIVTVWRKK